MSASRGHLVGRRVSGIGSVLEPCFAHAFSKPSPALVVASLALFVALSGAALAVEAVTKNSVSSKSIRKGAVRSVDVKNGDLRGADIDESTL